MGVIILLLMFEVCLWQEGGGGGGWEGRNVLGGKSGSIVYRLSF